MTRVMAMFQANMAWYAKIIVVADSASNKGGLVEHYRGQHRRRGWRSRSRE